MNEVFELYENVKDLGFSEISGDEWNELCNRICNLDERLLTILPSDVGPAIGRIKIPIKISSQNQDADFKSINYMSIRIYEFVFLIYEFDDEYYGIYSMVKYHTYRLKCDQMYGLINAINYIKNTKFNI